MAKKHTFKCQSRKDAVMQVQPSITEERGSFVSLASASNEEIRIALTEKQTRRLIRRLKENLHG